MNRIIFILTLSAFLFSQEAEVTNIQAAQRTDGSQIVDITYDLSEDEVFAVFTITVEVSLDGGIAFSGIENAEGDLGEAIEPGIGKSITWDFGQQFTDTYSNQVQYKINAQSSATIIYACADSTAANYSPDATFDDGTCVYDEYGCTDPDAYNYNPEVTSDDGTCVYAGCTDQEAYNYNVEASINDGSCGDVNEECNGPFPEGDVPFEMMHVAPGDFLYHNLITANGSDCYIGDLNGDGGYNVLDIVSLANCVIANNCVDSEYSSCAGDMNGDTLWNVLDIVTLANCILSGSCSGGDAEYDYCGASTSMTEESIYFNSTDGNVYVNSDVAIAGFQFEIVGSEIYEASGGAANTNGFTILISISSTTVLSFSLSGATISPMNGVLVHLNLSSPETASITNVILSDPSGCAIHDYNITNNINGIATIDCNYEIMKYEVTDHDYVVFMLSAIEDEFLTVTEEGAWGPYVGDAMTDPLESIQYVNFDESKISWNGNIFEVDEGYPNHPATGVSYYGAYMFAEYYGMELPTGFEWQKAAIGMLAANYPWGENSGDDISDNANYIDSGDPWDNGTTPVGYYNGENATTDSPSPYGVYDMAGNISEWLKRQSDGGIITIGGNYSDNSDQLYINIIETNSASLASSSVGFRCIRRLPAE